MRIPMLAWTAGVFVVVAVPVTATARTLWRVVRHRSASVDATEDHVVRESAPNVIDARSLL
jgi:hypothetical protein